MLIINKLTKGPKLGFELTHQLVQRETNPKLPFNIFTGFPATIVLAGTSFVTTEPAATIELSPNVCLQPRLRYFHQSIHQCQLKLVMIP